MNAPTMYEGWWEVPDGLLLASQLAAMDLPRIPGGEVAGIVQAENWHAYGRDDQFKLYRLAESVPSPASAAQLEAADAKRTKERVYHCQECGAWSEQVLPTYPTGDDVLLKGIEPRRLCSCCRHLTRLTGYRAYYAGRRADVIGWAARMAAPGAALAISAREIRPAGTTAAGRRHPVKGVAVLAFDIADGHKVFDFTVLRRRTKYGPRRDQLEPEQGVHRLRLCIGDRTLIGWRAEQLEPLRPILAPKSRAVLGQEAHTRVTDWRSDLDTRTGRPRPATDPGRPDRLALLIRRMAATGPTDGQGT